MLLRFIRVAKRVEKPFHIFLAIERAISRFAGKHLETRIYVAYPTSAIRPFPSIARTISLVQVQRVVPSSMKEERFERVENFNIFIAIKLFDSLLDQISNF